MLCVLGGVGLVRGARLVGERLSPGRARAALVVALVVAAPFAVAEVLALDGSWRAVRGEARDNGALPGLIERAGGRDAVVGCGLAFTRGFQTQVIAYELGTHESGVALDPEPPGTIIALEGEEMLEDDRFPYRVANKDWTLASSCPLPGTTR